MTAGFFSAIDDGLEYDNLFEDEWAGTSSRRALGRLRPGSAPEAAHSLARRKRNFTRLCERFGRPDVFVLPRTLDGLDTAWHMFPVLIRPESGMRRSAFQQHMEGAGVDTHGLDERAAA